MTPLLKGRLLSEVTELLARCSMAAIDSQGGVEMARSDLRRMEALVARMSIEIDAILVLVGDLRVG